MVAAKPGLANQLLGQAASAWLKAEKPEEAFRVQSLALKHRPNDIDILIDRSLTLVSAAKYWEAIDDLNQAIELDLLRSVDARGTAPPNLLDLIEPIYSEVQCLHNAIPPLPILVSSRRSRQSTRAPRSDG